MSVKILDSVGGVNEAIVDGNKNLSISEGIPYIGATGGFYTVTGQTSAAIAASLAANTSLMSMRLSAGSARKAYITRMRVLLGASTVGASALVPGTIGLQRFTTATPSGGTARTANRQDEAAGSATDITDIRDNNAALTVTSVVFGNVVASSLVPIFVVAGAMWSEWVLEPPYPIVLQPGDGLALRTQVALPATQTTMFSYTFHWFEQ